MDLSARTMVPEVMDDEDLDPAIYARCLTDLASVNRVTLTHRPTLAWLGMATRQWPAGSTLSVLDVACGHGDLLRRIHRWATRRHFIPVLTGLDLNPKSAITAAAATPPDMPITWRTGDVFTTVPEPAPDFIVTSQFTHHLLQPELVAFLRWIDTYSVRGWFISDLHRHVIPYYGFRVLARIAGWHRIVRTDGTASIARSFRRADWIAALAQAGVSATVTWRFPFRLTVGQLR